MPIKNINFENPNDFIDKLVESGFLNKASDIHVSPGINNVLIKFRIGRELVPIYSFSNEKYSSFINAMKIKSGMDISEHNHVQDGKFFLKIQTKAKEVGINIRVSSLPVLHGENIVMRILLEKSEYSNLESLGFSEENLKSLKNISTLAEGLVLVCGGTGSGKTTTIYSILNSFDKTTKGIFTLEDPIEYQVDGYVQSQINNVKGSGNKENSYTFKEGLVGILRQDPDIIMIGEIRQEEEARTCFEAANTGHIVLGTIHSNNAISTITRIRQFGIEAYLIASGLKYIISQKMVKTLCPHCRQKVKINKSELRESFQKRVKSEDVIIFKSNLKGCNKCKNGFHGTRLIGEIIKIDDKIYDLLLADETETEIKEHLLNNGFVPYYIDAFDKCLNGEICYNDVLELEY